MAISSRALLRDISTFRTVICERPTFNKALNRYVLQSPNEYYMFIVIQLCILLKPGQTLQTQDLKQIEQTEEKVFDDLRSINQEVDNQNEYNPSSPKTYYDIIKDRLYDFNFNYGNATNICILFADKRGKRPKYQFSIILPFNPAKKWIFLTQEIYQTQNHTIGILLNKPAKNLNVFFSTDDIQTMITKLKLKPEYFQTPYANGQLHYKIHESSKFILPERKSSINTPLKASNFERFKHALGVDKKVQKLKKNVDRARNRTVSLTRTKTKRDGSFTRVRVKPEINRMEAMQRIRNHYLERHTFDVDKEPESPKKYPGLHNLRKKLGMLTTEEKARKQYKTLMNIVPTTNNDVIFSTNATRRFLPTNATRRFQDEDEFNAADASGAMDDFYVRANARDDSDVRANVRDDNYSRL